MSRTRHLTRAVGRPTGHFVAPVSVAANEEIANEGIAVEGLEVVGPDVRDDGFDEEPYNTGELVFE